MPTRCVRNASSVSSGNQEPTASFAFSPASTSSHSMRRSPPKAFSTAASNTRTAAAQMSGFGGMLSFELAGGAERGMSFAKELRVIQLAVSLGGAESILQHPASMSHGSLGPAELEKAGIAGGLFRLSVGLENADDLENDIGRALDNLPVS